MTRQELLKQGAARLARAHVPSAQRDARVLLRWAAGLDAAGLASKLAVEPSVDEMQRFRSAVDRRCERVPVSQITGVREFWGRSFRVTSDVLDPRPETETLIATALELGPTGTLLDLGTGSGCIAITLLAEWPDARGVAVDVSQEALALAGENAASLGVDARLTLRTGRWFGTVDGEFDLVISNPPYIRRGDIDALAPEVRLHEPFLALDGGQDGLDAYRAIASGAGRVLARSGLLLVEIGPDQAEDVTSLFAAAAFDVAQPIRDMDGRDRVIAARPTEISQDSGVRA